MCAQGLGDGEDERSTPSHRSALAELPKGNINHIVTKERLNSSGITASTLVFPVAGVRDWGSLNAAASVPIRLVRFSIGLEAADVLIADLERGFAALAASTVR